MSRPPRLLVMTLPTANVQAQVARQLPSLQPALEPRPRVAARLPLVLLGRLSKQRRVD